MPRPDVAERWARSLQELIGIVRASLLPDPRLEPTMSVEAGGSALGIGRAAAYAQAALYEQTDGVQGLPVLRLGHSLRVPTAALWRLVGLDPDAREPGSEQA